MNDNILLDKSKLFAIRIIKLHKFLVGSKKEFVMSKQLLKSGTSIGANIHEANYAISKKEFIAKLQISLKEAAETQYWLELLFQTEYIDGKQYESVLTDNVELLKMLTASLKTVKK